MNIMHACDRAREEDLAAQEPLLVVLFCCYGGHDLAVVPNIHSTS
jgi:hypothetical protein